MVIPGQVEPSAFHEWGGNDLMMDNGATHIAQLTATKPRRHISRRTLPMRVWEVLLTYHLSALCGTISWVWSGRSPT
jgi:hypothetical protein